MPLLSFRPKQKAPASAPVEAPAPSAGKKARFDTDKEKDAAVKIQAIKRGQDQRKENSAKNVLQKPAFNRKASFSAKVEMYGEGTIGNLVAKLTAALNNCLASLPSQCVPPGGTSERRNSLPKDAALEKKSRYSDSSTVLSEAMLAKVKLLFDKLDQDGDGTVTKKEAQAFWKKNWANVNATAMFNEVDDDGARVYRRSNTRTHPKPPVVCSHALPSLAYRQRRGDLRGMGRVLAERARAARV